MSNPALFKWRHVEAEIILCAVQWYLRYALSYRDVEELTIQGYEAMHMLRKGQLEGVAKGDVLAQNQVINQLFGVVT
jgi:hypothetical protein